MFLFLSTLTILSGALGAKLPRESKQVPGGILRLSEKLSMLIFCLSGIFSVVKFANDACTSSTTAYNGTCLTSNECTVGIECLYFSHEDHNILTYRMLGALLVEPALKVQVYPVN